MVCWPGILDTRVWHRAGVGPRAICHLEALGFRMDLRGYFPSNDNGTLFPVGSYPLKIPKLQVLFLQNEDAKNVSSSSGRCCEAQRL